MSKPGAEVEVKVFLDIAGKYAPRNMIFGRTYKIDEIERDFLTIFVVFYMIIKVILPIIVKTADKAYSKENILPTGSTVNVAA